MTGAFAQNLPAEIAYSAVQVFWTATKVNELK